jgi:selenocysteine-specific elongation factor
MTTTVGVELGARRYDVRLGAFDADAVAGAQRTIEDHIRANGSILAKDARDILNTSRKYVVPLLEYFDGRGVTRRDGDVRTLRSV